MISLKAVNKHYGTQQVLQDINLEIASNAITLILGPSGGGKSTLLKVINGLVTPDSGEVKCFGEALKPENLEALRQKMGYAVQGNGLFPHLSARQNICILAEMLKWSAGAINTRLEQLLEMMQLAPELLDKYPHQLSGGQQQRVGLCRAMMLNPPVLLLDEPFAAIDPTTREGIHQALLHAQAIEPRTTLLVSHDIQEAKTLADRVIYIQDGKLVLHQHADAGWEALDV